MKRLYLGEDPATWRRTILETESLDHIMKQVGSAGPAGIALSSGVDQALGFKEVVNGGFLLHAEPYCFHPETNLLLLILGNLGQNLVCCAIVDIKENRCVGYKVMPIETDAEIHAMRDSAIEEFVRLIKERQQ